MLRLAIYQTTPVRMLRKLRQVKDLCEFKASLVYRERVPGQPGQRDTALAVSDNRETLS